MDSNNFEFTFPFTIFFCTHKIKISVCHGKLIVLVAIIHSPQDMVPFWQLCQAGHLALAREAIAKGEDVNRGRGTNGNETGLMMALLYNKNSIVELLLEQPNMDLNKTDDLGHSALHYAVVSKNIDGLKLLLADPRLTTTNHKDSLGETPLMSAIINNNKEALLQLVDHPRVNLDLSMDDIKDLVVNTFGGTSQEERIKIARLVF